MKTSLRFLVGLLLIAATFTAIAEPNAVRVMYTADPATTFTVGHSYDPAGAPSFDYILHFDTVDHGDDFAAYANTHAVDRTVNGFKSWNHYFFRLTDLDPATKYFFTISYNITAGVEATRTAGNSFWTKTMTNDPTVPLSIVAGGDSRADLDNPDRLQESLTVRQQGNTMVAKLRPDFVSFGGDYTFANGDNEWWDWLNDWELTYTDDRQIIPLVGSVGNHEYISTDGEEIMLNFFDSPHPDIYYALDFNGGLLRHYSLNTEIAQGGAQGEWLANDLAAHDNETTRRNWKMAAYHRPIRPHHNSKSDQNNAYQAWSIPFYNHQLRLVLESDAHVVKTTHEIRPTESEDGTIECGDTVEHGFVKTNNRGTVYFGEGTWAALRNGNDAKLWTREMDGFPQVKWLFVYPDSVEIRTVYTDTVAGNADAEYANNVEALPENDRFRVPNGVKLWEPASGALVTLYDNGLTPLPEGTNGGPCIDEVQDTATIGINEIAPTFDLFVANNPSLDGSFSVNLNNISAQNIEISVLDINGREVSTQNVEVNGQSTIQTVNIGGNAAGTYLLNVSGDGYQTTEKLILLQ